MSHNKTSRQQDAGASASCMNLCSLALAVRLVAAGALLGAPLVHAQQAEQGAPLELGATAITDTVTPADDAVTEGTQSYTSRAARTATPLNMSLRETPQSVGVVTQQRIQDQNLQTITDVVNNTTGISMNRYETDRGQINARGFELNSLMIDGVPTIWDQAWSSGEIFSSLAMYDRVEVVRGANGLMTGVGDPSASLNMVRKRANSRELTGSVEASGGSWDTYGTKGDISMPLNESGTVRARLVGELNDGDSWIDMKSSRRETLYGTMDIDLTPDTTLWFGLSHQTTDNKSPMWGGLPVWYADGTRTNWSRSKTSSAGWSRWETTYDTYFINLDHTFANDWQVNLSYNRGERKSESKLLYVSGNPVMGGGTPALSTFPGWYKPETVQDDYSIRFNGPVSLFGRDHELAFGYINSQQDFDVDYHAPVTGFEGIANFDSYKGGFPEPTWAPLASYGYSDVEQKSLFAATRLNLTDDLKLILGARDTSYKKTSDDIFSEVSKIDARHELTPYAGAVYDLTENLSAYVSYTEIFLPQSERGSDLKVLEPIVGESYETGLKAEFLDGRLNTSAAIFRIKQDNLAQSTGTLLTGGMPGEFAYEGTDVTSEGFELEVSGELAEGWNATVGYTQFKVRDANGDAANTLFPTKLLRTFTTYRLPGVFNKLTIGGGVNWQDSSYTDALNPQGVNERINIDSYALVNLMARYDITDNLSAQLNADNVTDEKYFDVFDAFGSLTYGAPRSLTASAKYRF
ncbi:MULTISPECIES: TonB-dependent siderophore receptor [Pseudomonas]|uniref:Outer membrane receptor for ferric coprogen and ferric-rhodotorulic acid n=1 Tax=Phytopseudomonas flavescens TaxID=29435 RepID=A0A7Z0BRJ7_9GAMM|nr:MULTISPECIES: TonB-dependent siderophore receptor [Pseudomonas]MCW2290423.1 outer membrane receptor for ferric coprogen and ferric-rhodotorulic acid [Pseudomonas sp. BIGb0408]NYH75004.1 outer membrane receptor for ferric coprogen and ferric-rhodotorulic acid [Pseudomonas flavescens]